MKLLLMVVSFDRSFWLSLKEVGVGLQIPRWGAEQ